MEKEICTLVEATLKLDAGSVQLSDGPQSLEAWDSLGLLSILSALEQKFGGPVAQIDDLAGVQNVQDIVNILKRENIG